MSIHRYCLDTSGLSNPVMELPDDIYITLWRKIETVIKDHVFCWNKEIDQELEGIPGSVGGWLKECSGSCCYELGKGQWPWDEYLNVNNDLREKYKGFISENNGGRKNTVGFNDISIVSFSKVMKLPLISMETRNHGEPSPTKMRIPDVCSAENIAHYNFTEFLRREGIKI